MYGPRGRGRGVGGSEEEAWIRGGKKERSRLKRGANAASLRENVVVARATAPSRGALSLLFADLSPLNRALF